MEARKLKQETTEEKLKALNDNRLYDVYLKYKEFIDDCRIASNPNFQEINDSEFNKLRILIKDYKESGIDIPGNNDTEAMKNARLRLEQYKRYMKFTDVDLTKMSDKRVRSVACGIINRENKDMNVTDTELDKIFVLENIDTIHFLSNALEEMEKKSCGIEDTSSAEYISIRNNICKKYQLNENIFQTFYDKFNGYKQTEDFQKFDNNYYLMNNEFSPAIVRACSAVGNLDFDKSFEVLQDLSTFGMENKKNWKNLSKFHIIEGHKQNEIYPEDYRITLGLIDWNEEKIQEVLEILPKISLDNYAMQNNMYNPYKDDKQKIQNYRLYFTIKEAINFKNGKNDIEKKYSLNNTQREQLSKLAEEVEQAEKVDLAQEVFEDDSLEK